MICCDCGFPIDNLINDRYFLCSDCFTKSEICISCKEQLVSDLDPEAAEQMVCDRCYNYLSEDFYEDNR